MNANLSEAIIKRTAIRKYKQEILLSEELEKIREYIEQVFSIDKSIKTSFEIIDNSEFKEVMIGRLACEAPYYLCIRSEKKGDYLINAGFMAEQIVLYLTSLGIGTCYLGGAKPKENEKEKLSYIITVAFGYPSVVIPDFNSSRRLPLEKLVYAGMDTDDKKEIIKAAQLAPSAVNFQPTRYLIENNKIHIGLKYSLIPIKKMQQIDLGIALSHIMIKSAELKYKVMFKKFDGVKMLPNYQISAVIEEE